MSATNDPVLPNDVVLALVRRAERGDKVVRAALIAGVLAMAADRFL